MKKQSTFLLVSLLSFILFTAGSCEKEKEDPSTSSDYPNRGKYIWLPCKWGGMEFRTIAVWIPTWCIK